MVVHGAWCKACDVLYAARCMIVCKKAVLATAAASEVVVYELIPTVMHGNVESGSELLPDGH